MDLKAFNKLKSDIQSTASLCDNYMSKFLEFVRDNREKFTNAK